MGCLQLKARGNGWAGAPLPYGPGLATDLPLRLGRINVAECCVDRLWNGLLQEQVWHLSMHLSYGSSSLLHAESCVGVHPLHELILDIRCHLRLLYLHGLW